MNNKDKFVSVNMTTESIDLTKEEEQKPVTKEEALAHVIKKLESEIFIERNCSSLKTEDQIARLTLIMQYVRENLK